MSVNIFFNLHDRLFSLRFGKEPVRHAYSVIVYNPWFIVQPAGHRRVLKEGKKNVHAFVRAEEREAMLFPPTRWRKRKDEIEVTYNPYLAAHFYVRELGPNYKVLGGSEVRLVTRHGRPRMYVQDAIIEEA